MIQLKSVNFANLAHLTESSESKEPPGLIGGQAFVGTGPFADLTVIAFPFDMT